MQIKRVSKQAIVGSLLFLIVSIVAVISPTLVKGAITDTIVAHWNMDETSGNRADSVGANTLTPSSSGNSTSGKIGNAFATTGSSSGNLNIADNANLSTGNIDYTLATWVKFNSVAGNQGVVMKYQSATTEKEYGIFLTASKLRYIVASSSGTTVSVDSPTVATGTWYFVVAWLDADAKTLNIQVNNGAIASVNRTTVVPQDGVGALTVGSYNNTNFLNGAVDSLSLWKRLLTPTERTQLYSDGAGLDYPFTVVESTAPTEPLNVATSIVSSGEMNLAWDLPASSGNEAITDYIVEYKASADSIWSTYADGTSANLYATVTGLSNGTAYDFRVSATNSVGTGPTSSVVSATPRAGTITLTSPKAYQVFQRNASDIADIVISGTYTGSPSAIEASWDGQSYQTITASPTGGTFAGTLSGQDTGQGTLSVRFTNDTVVEDNNQYVGVGDVYVIAGQSNASGRSSNNQSYSHASLKAALFGNNDSWGDLQDPTDNNTGQTDAVSEDSQVNKGSFWPLLATRLMEQENVPLAFVPTAKGGSIIRQWQKNSTSAIVNSDTTAYSSCSTSLPLSGQGLYKSMSRRINLVPGGVKAVLFVQGETDAINGLGGEDYKDYLRCFGDNVLADFGIKTVAAQIGYDNNSGAAANNDDVNAIRLAQQELWDEDGSIQPGPVLYDIETGDGVHFVSNEALGSVADRFWSAIDELYYDGPDGRGPRLASAEHNADKTYIDITFTDASLPITPTSSIEGFSVKDDGNTAAISSVSRVTNSTVRLNLSSAANGNLTVSLASGNADGYMKDVPKDSSSYALPAEPFVDVQVTALPLGAPTSVSATAGDAQASVSFVAPSEPGESAITSYTVTSNPGGIIATGNTSPITVTGLTNGTSYTFTVHATNSEGDGQESSASNSVTPTEPFVDPDSDQDGIDSAVEQDAPNDGDANNDSLQDNEQANVASFVNPQTGNYVSLAVDEECTITDISSVAELDLSANDKDYTYPFGLLDFVIECDSATVNQYFYSQVNQDLVIRKFIDNTYTTIDDAVISSVVIDGNNVTQATYTIGDGGPGDEDATVNGIIVDPAGPAVINDSVGSGQEDGQPTNPGSANRSSQDLAATGQQTLPYVGLVTLLISATAIYFLQRRRVDSSF